MQTVIMAVIMAAMMAGQPAADGQKTQVDAVAQHDSFDQAIQSAFAQIRAGQNDQALATLDPLVVRVKTQIADANARVFCPQSQSDILAYTMRATPAAPKIRLLAARNCEVLFLRAYVLENLHQLPEAIAQLRQLLELEPNFPHVRVEYASALRQSGDLDGALAAYRLADGLAAPVAGYALDQAAAQRGIGFVLTEKNDLDGAEKAYRRSLELAPGNAIATNELAYIGHLRAKGAKAKSVTVESRFGASQAAAPQN